jgi:hypothetical protein
MKSLILCPCDFETGSWVKDACQLGSEAANSFEICHNIPIPNGNISHSIDRP